MANGDPKKLLVARSVINNGLRDGKIRKPARCQGCKTATSRLEAHHPDHDQPSRVRWLCATCHHNVDDKSAWRSAAKKATGE